MSYHSQFDELNFEPFLLPNEVFSQIFVKINIKLLQRKKNSQKWVRWGLENMPDTKILSQRIARSFGRSFNCKLRFFAILLIKVAVVWQIFEQHQN